MRIILYNFPFFEINLENKNIHFFFPVVQREARGQFEEN
jgi:hypothetical protein